MKKIKPLHYKSLRPTIDPKKLKFKITQSLIGNKEFKVQERAHTAIAFGIGIKKQGYNLFAMGPSGIGKRSLIKAMLKAKAKKERVPSDWCYIHNFDDPRKALAIPLPAGTGSVFKEDMQSLMDALIVMILAVFESDEYRNGMLTIQDEFKKKQDLYTLKSHSEKNVKFIKNYNKKLIDLYKKKYLRERKLQLKLTAKVVKPLIKKLMKRYTEHRAVLKFLRSVQRDIILQVGDLIKKDETTHLLTFVQDSPVLNHYEVNLLVDNGNRDSAPVIFEDNPTHAHLICRVEYTTKFGTTDTNFTLIKPGSLHLANGGYLVLEAEKILQDRNAWEALKRALKTKKIVVEQTELPPDLFRPISLEPMPIPLNVKLVLIGSRQIYYDLCDEDPDFNELFKVIVDFDEQIDRNAKNCNLYAELVSSIIRKESLLPFDKEAVAEIIDHSSRIAEDNEKLSTDMQNLHDIVIEAEYTASAHHKKIVKASDVKRAIEAQHYRMNRSQQLYYEDIFRDLIQVHTQGEMIGQINCLSVVKVGRSSYGHPLRVTATVRRGHAKMIDIQREIKMAGPIHSKAGLTILNFFGARYAEGQAFRLCASISFEQIYGMVDGDSASVAEVCALLSALAQIPLKQSIAVTGSIDQYGTVQAVGGLNEKIEGFFRICEQRGLTGSQGVIVPAVNVKNLMLQEDIVKAARLKKFFIYPIHHIDEAMGLLSSVPMGPSKPPFEKNTVNGLVNKRLEQFSKR